MNQDYQEDHGRLGRNDTSSAAAGGIAGMISRGKNPLTSAKNWMDSIFQRNPEKGHIQETSYDSNLNSDPNSKPKNPRGSGTNRFGAGMGGRMH